MALKNLWLQKHSEKKYICCSCKCSGDSESMQDLVYMSCVTFCTHSSRHPDKCDGEWGRCTWPELQETTTGSRQGEIDGKLETLQGPLKWKWRKLQRFTGTNQLPGFRRLAASCSTAALTLPSHTLPHFFPLCRWYCYLCAGAFFFLHPFVGCAIIHPGPAARGTHRNKSASKDLWLAHFGHLFLFCFVFL